MFWYSHLFQNFPQFIVIHTVKGFGSVNKAEIDVFLELSCIFSDPVDVANLVSASSAFSKTSLNTWKFTVHVLLKPGLENPRDRGAWWAAVYGVAQSQTQLKQFSSSINSILTKEGQCQRMLKLPHNCTHITRE